MSLEITLLRLLRNRQRHDRLIKSIPLDGLEVKSKTIMEDFSIFFKEMQGVQDIEYDSFRLWFYQFRHPTLNEGQRALYDAHLKNILTVPADPALEAGLMERLLASESAARLADLLTKFQAGEDIDLLAESRAEVDRFERLSTRSIKDPFVTESIDDILDDDRHDRGLHWSLKCLNESMRPARGGDFIIVAARVDSGKTTAVCNEVRVMTPQFDAYWPGENRKTLWFNNEGPSRRIKQRLWQAVLDATYPQLAAMPAGERNATYARLMGGLDRVEFVDAHDLTAYEIEGICRRHPPGLIVFDMLDNVQGVKGIAGDRADQVLETKYQWGRLLGVKYDAVVIATSQTNGDAEGELYPRLTQLKESTTGKQGAADAVIMYGTHVDPIYENSRWVSIPKNKLHRPGGKKSPRQEVVFDGDRARLRDPGT